MRLVFTFAVMIAASLAPSAHAASPREVADALRAQIKASVVEVAPGRGHPDRAPLAAFYRARDYAPAWLSRDGDDIAAGGRVKQLLAILAGADREGLEPADYGGARIAELAEARDAEGLARLELLVSWEIAHYASDLRTGRAAPALADPELFVHAGEIDPLKVLIDAAAAPDLGAFFRHLTPANPVYRGLRAALAHYRALAAAGGWPRVPSGPAMKAGTRERRVATLRRILAIRGDMDAGESAGDAAQFDDALDAAVRRFQQRHGLEVDGVVGPKTLAALNVTAAERVHQIALNLERWRWMPDDLGRRYILVNIADFGLEVVADGAPALEMKVVVGKTYRRTPVFTGRMTYLEFNPYWNVPDSIARLDIVPKARADATYLRDNDFRVFQGAGGKRTEIDPTKIDWRGRAARTNHYQFRQEPGPKNALGRVKFMFPNRFNVYLHDTPSRELFERPVRTFSSGCIRVERPLALAEYLLAPNDGWDRAEIEAAIASGETQKVDLKRPIAVHITYSTAWAGRDGRVQFRTDIYGRDKLLDAALAAGAPAFSVDGGGK